MSILNFSIDTVCVLGYKMSVLINNRLQEDERMVKKSTTKKKSAAKIKGAVKKAQSKSSNPENKKTGKREKKKEQTKERILQSALELFRKKGFYKTTTKEISKRSKIAEGTLFNYFKTKEDLALYFFETEIQNCIDWFHQDDYIKSASLPEKLFAVTMHSLDRFEPYQEFIGAVYLRAFEPSSKLSPLSLDIQELRLKNLKFIRGILADAEDKEEIPPLGDFGAYALGIGYLGILTYWLNDKSEDKENTMALLDRSLKVAHHFLNRGGWDW